MLAVIGRAGCKLASHIGAGILNSIRFSTPTATCLPGHCCGQRRRHFSNSVIHPRQLWCLARDWRLEWDGELVVAMHIVGGSHPRPGTLAVSLGNGDGTARTEVDDQTRGGLSAVAM